VHRIIFRDWFIGRYIYPLSLRAWSCFCFVARTLLACSRNVIFSRHRDWTALCLLASLPPVVSLSVSCCLCLRVSVCVWWKAGWSAAVSLLRGFAGLDLAWTGMEGLLTGLGGRAALSLLTSPPGIAAYSASTAALPSSLPRLLPSC